MPEPAVQAAGNTIGNAQGVFNQTQSKRGPIAVPVRVNLVGATAYTLDLATLNNFNTIDFVQTIFVDNSLNTKAVYFYNGVSQQTLVVPPLSQAYLPFLVPNPGRFTITSTGNVVIPIELLNFPVAPAVWNAQNVGFSFDGAGNLLVSDKTLAQTTLTGSSLNVNVTNAAAGGTDPSYTRFCNQLGGAGGAGTLNILTGAPRYLLHHAAIYISPYCYLRSGVPGTASISIRDETNDICVVDFALPGAPPALASMDGGLLFDFPGLDIRAAADLNRLRIVLSADIGTSSAGAVVTLTAKTSA